MINDIFERIDNLMKHKGKRNKELLAYLEIDRNSYNNWKNGKSYSFIKHLDQIAEFLQVSSKFLLLGDADIDPETSQEIELLDLFRALPPVKRNMIISFLKMFSIETTE